MKDPNCTCDGRTVMSIVKCDIHGERCPSIAPVFKPGRVVYVDQKVNTPFKGKKIYSIDFDGVVATRERSGGVYKPLPGAIDGLCRIHAAGHWVAVLSANKDLDEIRQWLKQYVPFEIEVTNLKRFAHHYIDDRGYRFETWEKTIQDIL